MMWTVVSKQKSLQIIVKVDIRVENCLSHTCSFIFVDSQFKESRVLAVDMPITSESLTTFKMFLTTISLISFNISRCYFVKNFATLKSGISSDKAYAIYF